MNFRGKNILVVGGSSGIGLSLVKFLDKNDAVVYVISRSGTGDLPEGVKYLQADVTENLESVAAFLPDNCMAWFIRSVAST